MAFLRWHFVVTLPKPKLEERPLVSCPHLRIPVFPNLSSMGEFLTGLHFPRKPYLKKRIQTERRRRRRKRKKNLVGHVDYTSTANCRTNFVLYLGGYLEFFAVFKNVHFSTISCGIPAGVSRKFGFCTCSYLL